MAKGRVISLDKNNPHGLASAINLLAKGLPKYVQRLEALSESSDEKISLTATQALMNYYKDSVEVRDRAELQKLVLKLKMGQVGGLQKPVDNMPQIDFSTIREAT